MLTQCYQLNVYMLKSCQIEELLLWVNVVKHFNNNQIFIALFKKFGVALHTKVSDQRCQWIGGT